MKVLSTLAVALFFFTACKSSVLPAKEVQTSIRVAHRVFKSETPVKIIFTVNNMLERGYRFCYWQTPLEKDFTANFFEVILDGQAIPYTGKIIKRAPPQKNDYITLQANESVSEGIDLGLGYDLSKKGTYQVRFKGSLINGLPVSNQITFTIT